MTYEDPFNNPEDKPQTSRAKRVVADLGRIFGRLVPNPDVRFVAENSKTPQSFHAGGTPPTPELGAALRNLGVLPTDGVGAQPLATSDRDKVDLQWLHSSNVTGTDVVNAINTGRNNPPVGQ